MKYGYKEIANGEKGRSTSDGRDEGREGRGF